MITKNPLILASASPRRAELLMQIGVRFIVQPADIDEQLIEGESPGAYVLRLAASKARTVAERSDAAFVLGADTVVVVDGEILGKPTDDDDAVAMLTKLAGREHEVFTGVALAMMPPSEDVKSFVVSTKVHFRPLTHGETTAYVGSGEPMDKAGGYGIQGLGGMLVESIEGSYSNVVGLPLAETFALLSAFDINTGLSS